MLKNEEAKEIDYRDRLGTNLKDYMNREEVNDIFLQLVANIALGEFRTKQGLLGGITKEEHRNLSMAETYAKKALDSIMDRQETKTKKKLYDMLGKGYEVKILDQLTLFRLGKTMETEFKTAVMPRDEFMDFADHIISIKCNGCKMNHGQCDLYDVLDNNFIPHMGESKKCPYAFKINNSILEKKIELEERKKEVRKSMKKRGNK